ncbi:MAG: amidohydrolase family protein [Acidimicrobiia bacterium]|nr:amidohydrolase family protein [Acidimicrobiia bacterium]
MQDNKEPEVFRIDAEFIFTGVGDPIPNGSVVIQGGSIGEIGPSSQLKTPKSAVVYEVSYLLPGLWDAHIHFWGASKGTSLDRAFTHPALAGARSVKDAADLLSEGFTSVRCLGGVGIEIGAAITEGSCDGPTVYAAGSMLSIPGGHADTTVLPSWPLPGQSATRRICLGVDDCVTAVREQLRRGAAVIKICVSGGVMSDTDIEEQQFSGDELEAIVGEARRARRAVAAHAHGRAGILAAIRAGVTTIEHGSHLDEESANAMAEAGTILIPTRSILENAAQRTDLSPGAKAKAHGLEQANLNAVAIARSYNVVVASGSDLGISGSAGLHSYGKARSEISALVRAGLTPMEALEAATVHGPSTLGPQAPKSGLLKSGYPADLISVAFDPIEQPFGWELPGQVTHVWKSGRLVKSI